MRAPPLRTSDGQIRHPAEGSEQVYAELKALHLSMMEMSGDLWNWPSAATLTRPSLARILYLARIYEKIIPIPGVICEFGAHWGTTSVVLTNLRALLEPYNYSRRLFVFDTFQGFGPVHASDGVAQEGDFALPESYRDQLGQLLALAESLSPNSHIKKHEIFAGDASETVHHFLRQQPEAIVSLAIFDMDVYQPTKDALAAIMPRLTKGSLLVFDELNYPIYPGETAAVAEVLGLDKLRLRRDPWMPHCAWAVWE